VTVDLKEAGANDPTIAKKVDELIEKLATTAGRTGEGDEGPDRAGRPAAARML